MINTLSQNKVKIRIIIIFNNVNICFKISEKTNILYNKCTNSVNLVNNTYTKLILPYTIKNSKNKLFNLLIYSNNGYKGNAVTIYLTSTIIPHNKLFINNKLINANIVLKEKYINNTGIIDSLDTLYSTLYPSNPYILNGYYIYAIFVIAYLLFFFLISFSELLLLKNESIKRIIIYNFIMIAFIFGVAYIFNPKNLTIACNIPPYHVSCAFTPSTK